MRDALCPTWCRRKGIRVSSVPLIFFRAYCRESSGRRARRSVCAASDAKVPGAANKDLTPKAGQARITPLAAGQVLSMLVNGRLTARPPYEAVAVTNSVASVGFEGVSGRSRAKAVFLETYVLSAGSRFRPLRNAGRARLGSGVEPGHTAHGPACASHPLSLAREAAPGI